jgi:mRNA-degrading endonuclease YafQ of YafQ-DinJ toxin-antitoxin module
MELTTAELEKALIQIEKYNKDFTYYFLCLKTANYQIKELGREIKKVASIDLSKPRSEKSLRKISKLLTEATVINKNSYQLLEQELTNLKEILKYLKEQHPRFAKLSEHLLKADAENINSLSKKSSIKLITSLKKLNNNINLCDKYIIPKNELLLTDRKALQTRLEFKLNNIKKHFVPTQENN